MEKPLATMTLIAVTSEASRIAFIVVIDLRPLIVATRHESFPRKVLKNRSVHNAPTGCGCQAVLNQSVP